MQYFREMHEARKAELSKRVLPKAQKIGEAKESCVSGNCPGGGDSTQGTSAPKGKKSKGINFTETERAGLKNTKYFYEIVFEKQGGLVMPILAEITYADGSKENKYYPAEIWRYNNAEISKTVATDKKVKKKIIS